MRAGWRRHLDDPVRGPQSDARAPQDGRGHEGIRGRRRARILGPVQEGPFLKDDARPRLIERARGGDWDAIEDLVSGAVAPTFDAALHLMGDPARAAHAA